MAQAGADQVAVDLVGHYPEPVLFDDGRHAAQFLLGPDAAGGVVGIAEHQQLHVRIGGLRLKVLPVHGEAAVFLPQGRGHQLNAVVFTGVEEESVGRRHGQDLAVQRLDQVFRQLVQRRDDAGRERQLLLGEGPAVTTLAPGAQRLIITLIVHQGIAQNAPIYPVGDGLQDLRRHSELHVRHPHPDEFLVLVGEHPLRPAVENVGPPALYILGIGVAPINDLVEVVGHGVSLLSCYGFIIPAAARPVKARRLLFRNEFCEKLSSQLYFPLRRPGKASILKNRGSKHQNLILRKVA